MLSVLKILTTFCVGTPQEVGTSNIMLPEPASRGTYINFKIGAVDYQHINLPEKKMP